MIQKILNPALIHEVMRIALPLYGVWAVIFVGLLVALAIFTIKRNRLAAKQSQDENEF